MPVSMEFLRGLIGIIGIGCAYMAGRSAYAVRKGWQKVSRLYGWIIRAVVCLGAVMYRSPFDLADVVVLALMVIAFAVAMWEASRVRKEDDLTHTMFPGE